MAAANASRCNGYECQISFYDVTVENDGSGDLLLTIVDPCNTLSQQSLAKNVLINALQQFYVSEGVSTAGLCGTPTSLCECTYPAGGVLTWSTQTYNIALPGGATVPPSPVTFTVNFPL